MGGWEEWGICVRHEGKLNGEGGGLVMWQDQRRLGAIIVAASDELDTAVKTAMGEGGAMRGRREEEVRENLIRVELNRW